MTVVKRTTNELVIEGSDPALPACSVRFVRDEVAEQVVSVQSTDGSTAESEQVGLDHDDLLVLLSWLADAIGVERYVPSPECGNVDGWSETACLLPPGHYGQHEGIGARWLRSDLP